MKPIDKTSNDLFQKLRSRYAPVTLGNKDTESTTDPNEARFFNFVYTENEEPIGPVSISIVDNRAFKVFYGSDLVERVGNSEKWFRFLKELRDFAKRNLMSFDARDLAKSQLEKQDFTFISKVDGSYNQKDVTVSESNMYGSRRKSYQVIESVKMIVNHKQSIDDSIPGARSRYIESIYIERPDGERYKFPYNYLTGARAMTRHVAEGGTPYDEMGTHILSIIKEMKDLSLFARRTKKHAMEDTEAGTIREKVIERFHSYKHVLGALSLKEGYTSYRESYKPAESKELTNLEQLRERFTVRVFDQQIESVLPTIGRVLEDMAANLAEASKSVENKIKDPNWKLVLRKDDAADELFTSSKFTDGSGLVAYILSDIASRAIGDDMDALANFASDASERMQDKTFDKNDKQLAMLLAKKYMDDIEKILNDPSYADMVRLDPKDVYGRKKKRAGGFHEAETFESWANEVTEAWAGGNWQDPPAYAAIMHRVTVRHPELIKKYGKHRISDTARSIADNLGDLEEIGSSDVSIWVKQLVRDLGEMSEATTQGTVGTSGTTGTSGASGMSAQTKAKQAQQAATVSRAVKNMGMNIPTGDVSKALAATRSGKPLGSKDKQTLSAIGANVVDIAGDDPKAAAKLAATAKTAKRENQEKDESPIFEKEISINNDDENEIINDNELIEEPEIDVSSLKKLAGLK